MKKLGFGTMRLPLLEKGKPEGVDIEQFKKMVDIFLEKGFTYFDTAYVYHEKFSEDAVKQALVERYPREAFQIATKLPHGYVKSFEDRDRIFQKQLENVGVTYFDNYLLHCVMATNYHSVFEKYDCFNWLFDLKKQGLVKNAGFSYHDTADLLDEILTTYPDFDFVQLQINYLDWDSNDVQSRKCYEVAVKHGKKVIVMEPVKGGALVNVSPKVEALFKSYDSNVSIASWGIRFAATLENVWYVLSGMSDLDQVKDNTAFMSEFKKLTEEEMEMCHEAADIINSERAVKCTGCAYCVAGCPMHIQIPTYFEMYNRRMQATSAGTLMRSSEYFKKFSTENAAPSDCIECGQCESACPQHLSIRAYLKDVTAEYNK